MTRDADGVQDPVEGTDVERPPEPPGHRRQVEVLLFVSGDTAMTHRAIQTLMFIAKTVTEAQVSFQVIDVLEDPERAERERILATPALVKLRPTPRSRILGDLSDVHRVLRAIGLPSGAALSSSSA